jgi:LysR family transcriptional regulator for metE and metH
MCARPVGEHGLWSDLFVSVPPAQKHKACAGLRQRDTRAVRGALDGIKLLS